MKLRNPGSKPRSLKEAREFSQYAKEFEQMRKVDFEQAEPGKKPKIKRYSRIVSQTNGYSRKHVDFRYSVNIEYDFLQYIRVVMLWGREKLGVTNSALEFLLYLYPIGLFTRKDFQFCRRQLGIHAALVWAKCNAMERMGLIEKTDLNLKCAVEKADIFKLSKRTQTVIKKMHAMAIGKEPLPKVEKLGDISSSQEILSKYYITMKEKFE